MRVAVVTAYYPSPAHLWDGRSAHETLRELDKLAEVEVFFPLPRHPRWVEWMVRKDSTGSRDMRPAGPPVRYLDYLAIPGVSRPFNGRSIVRRLVDEVRAYQPDVILNYVIYPAGYAAVEIGRELGVPVVLTSTGSDLNRDPGPLLRGKRRAALKGTTTMTTVSHDLARTAVKLGSDPKHTVAILNGCDTALFRPRDRAAARTELGLPMDAEIVLYVGRYDVRKGLMELVDAAAALRESRPRLHHYLLGSGPDEALLRKRIAALGLEKLVHLVAPAYGERVALWNAACDVATLPSYMEGCPNVVLEALASGRPVVATDVGGIPELIDASCGSLVPARDARALAEGLREALEQRWSAEAIAGAHARSWADVAQELYGVLAEAIERRSVSGGNRIQPASGAV